MDQMPHLGKEAIGAFPASQTAKVNLTLDKTGISKSGDLGFAYGNYETLSGEKGAKSEKSVFFRI